MSFGKWFTVLKQTVIASGVERSEAIFIFVKHKAEGCVSKARQQAVA
jgi:hypothetical protein